MHALIVIDAQNEFSKDGQRPVPNFIDAVARIQERVAQARLADCPIAWVRHFNRPHESRAFIPESWGSQFYSGLGPSPDRAVEAEFQKNVYGAFAGTDVGLWLESHRIRTVLVVGFYTHACVSTTAREALMMDFEVFIDYAGTGACALNDPRLGTLTAEQVRQSALLQLANMGVRVIHEMEELKPSTSKVIQLTPLRS